MRIKPKKSLGQNFLADKNIVRKIISACGFGPSDMVLEIGAGRGEMTVSIAGLVKEIHAVEIDSGLSPILVDNLRPFQNARVINQDILKLDLDGFFKESGGKIKIFGNIPYYITTPIIEKVFAYRDKIGAAYFTVQKEFAERIAANPGSKVYGSFSCFVQYYAVPKILFTISKSCFSPAPKVDSCLLQLEIRAKPPVMVKDEKLFFKVIRSAFNKRRKILRNSLKDIVPEDRLNDFFLRYNIDPRIRPECFSLEDFANLSNL
ncbi:MAG: 16S rRNA (adenine(1518)-N(6)/adenine(1519)-N(6))-dimethyltransferase RsmA [Candidatus Omnitrophica bacterium]|nr:16S rRNA (adenine(1518)-N(6)/adenine(1519)-N(6))-dimethyltransferase RsmA [Candidatus Omnitrophota bacterium]